MKLEKITISPRLSRERWYEDACGTAMALELVGERWSLLILRELMFGPRRFSDLRKGLPGVSANILTQRLESLEETGLLVRHKLPPPVSVQVYELTPFGYSAETVIQELGRWAAQSPLHDPSLPLSAASLMMSFRTMFDPRRAAGVTATIGLSLEDETFRADISGGRLHVARGPVDGADLVLTGPPAAIAAAVYGGQSLGRVEKAAHLRLEGSRPLARQFVTWFPLPKKL